MGITSMFTVGETKAQTGEMTYPQSQSEEMKIWFEPNYFSPKSLFFFYTCLSHHINSNSWIA